MRSLGHYQTTSLKCHRKDFRPGWLAVPRLDRRETPHARFVEIATIVG